MRLALSKFRDRIARQKHFLSVQIHQTHLGTHKCIDS